MKRLIKDQNIKFDTHQAGDRQKINLNGLHLEKILHKPKGIKLKFHFFDSTASEKQNSNVNKQLLKKKEEFEQLIMDTLQRYHRDGITEKYALKTAQNIASYFNLNKDFVSKVIKYGKNNSIIEATTIQEDAQTHKRHSIKQTKKDITISSRRNK